MISPSRQSKNRKIPYFYNFYIIMSAFYTFLLSLYNFLLKFIIFIRGGAKVLRGGAENFRRGAKSSQAWCAPSRTSSLNPALVYLLSCMITF